MSVLLALICSLSAVIPCAAFCTSATCFFPSSVTFCTVPVVSVSTILKSCSIMSVVFSSITGTTSSPSRTSRLHKVVFNSFRISPFSSESFKQTIKFTCPLYFVTFLPTSQLNVMLSPEAFLSSTR